jgi:hypothetical protein
VLTERVMRVIIVHQEVSVSNSILKNKKSTYFLLPLTLGIWGFIGYKIYQYMNAGDEDIVISENIQPLNTEKITADTFSLFNNYRDPFLGNDGKEMGGSSNKANYSNFKYTSNNNIPKPKKNLVVAPTNTVSTNTGWPKITYNGMMVNESSKQSIAFISVDGVSNRVKFGDKVNDIKVIAFDQNGITLQKGKEKKVVGR